MENPWENLEEENGQWVLRDDRKEIDEFNLKAKQQHRIQLAAIPEPFIGSPKTARLVLLGLNPGFSSGVIECHREVAFQQAILNNLQMRDTKYPFYPLNPNFSHTGAAIWWRKHLRTLLKDCGLQDEVISRRIMAVEWFPYPSKSFGSGAQRILKSQHFSFELVRQISQCKGVYVLGMRAETRWKRSLESIEIPFLNSPQSAYVTPRNMPSGNYARIVELLCRPD